LTPRGTEHGAIVKRLSPTARSASSPDGDDVLQPNDVLLIKPSWF